MGDDTSYCLFICTVRMYNTYVCMYECMYASMYVCMYVSVYSMYVCLSRG